MESQRKKRKLVDVPGLVPQFKDDTSTPLESGNKDDFFEGETVEDKRVRLAKQYIDKLKQADVQPDMTTSAEGISEDHPDYDLIAHRLNLDVNRKRGRMFYTVAQQLVGHDLSDPSYLHVQKGLHSPPTCIVLSNDEKYYVTADKDGTVIKWAIEDGKKIYLIKSKHRRRKGVKKQLTRGHGHTGAILCIALSSDDKYMVTGGQDKQICIWNFADGTYVDVLPGHKGPVTGLVFAAGTHNLYSCSYDRTIKAWSLDAMAYLDTFFGHQSEAMAIDFLSSFKQRCISVGMDRTVRVWKLEEEKQLKFEGPIYSIDCVGCITDEIFLTGSQEGSVSLWNISKKRPIVTINPHESPISNWITSVAGLRTTNLAASGASDGFLRLWQCGKDSLMEVAKVPVAGFINGIVFAPSGQLMVAAIGQEPRLGRWARDGQAQNSILIIKLPITMASK